MRIRFRLATAIVFLAAMASSTAFPQDTVRNDGSSVNAEPATSSVPVATNTAPAAVAPPAAPQAPENPPTANAAQPPAGSPQPTAGLKEAALIAPEPPELRKSLAPIVPAPARPSVEPTAGEILYNQTHDASVMDAQSWAVSVNKSRHELAVYYKGRLFHKYEAVFGRRLDLAPKHYANDRRTPEGVYTIIKKYRSRRFHWFLKLNYPNLLDREHYAEMLDHRVVPVDDDGEIAGVGGAIGIHGTDVPMLNEGLINWTMGCISVNNRSIDELARYLPVGTVVIIKP